jgi:hypothetical protein
MNSNTDATPDHDPIYAALDGLLAGLQDTSRHAQAIVAIDLCIDHGINTLPRLIGVLQKKGFSRGHVANLIKESVGADPEANRWFRDAEGFLHCHPDSE